MINNRASFRLRKQIDLAWAVPEQKIEGKGRITNISLSGIAFETDQLFDPEHGMVIDLKVKEISSFPPQAKLMWFRRVGRGETHYQCGMKFLSKDLQDPAWHQWMDENISRLGDAQDSNIIDRYLS